MSVSPSGWGPVRHGRHWRGNRLKQGCCRLVTGVPRRSCRGGRVAGHRPDRAKGQRVALAEGYRVAARSALGAAHKVATKVDVDVNCQGEPPMTISTPPTPATALRIEAVAQRTGLTKRTIRYYEEIGLLSPSGRSEGGFRLFSEADVARLRRIVTLRDSAGLSLADVAELLDAESVRERIRERYLAAEDPAQKRAMLAESHEVLARQLALIERKRHTLDELATEYEERLQRIARLDAELAEEAEQAETQGAQAE